MNQIITIIGIIIAGAVPALAAGGAVSVAATIPSTVTATAAATASCPPDIAVKWYALMNYAALASGQNVSKLITESSTSGYVAVNISDIELKISYCSLNVTAAGGAKVTFVPAVGAGELKKLGLNITQARQIFEQLMGAHRETMANLSKYLRPLEHIGLKEVAEAFANDSGYLEAAQVNGNVSMALRVLAFVVENAAHNKTLAAELKWRAEARNRTTSLLMYVEAHGGLRGIQLNAVANLAAALNGSADISRAEAEVAESLDKLEAVLQLLESVNASQAAIKAVQSAVERHKIALDVLGNLSQAGGLDRVIRDLDDIIRSHGQIRPAVIALCNNVSRMFREMVQLDTSAVEAPAAKFEAICRLVQIFAPSDYLKPRPIILPLEEIKAYIRNRGGLLHVLQNPGLLAELNEKLRYATTDGVNVTEVGARGNITIAGNGTAIGDVGKDATSRGAASKGDMNKNTANRRGDDMDENTAAATNGRARRGR